MPRKSNKIKSPGTVVKIKIKNLIDNGLKDILNDLDTDLDISPIVFISTKENYLEQKRLVKIKEKNNEKDF